MAEIVELRKHPRSGGVGILAQIGGEIVDVVDISVAGIRVQRPKSWQPALNIQLHVIPLADEAHEVPVSGHVVGEEDNHLRIAFAAVSPALARIIGRAMRHMPAPSTDGWTRLRPLA